MIIFNLVLYTTHLLYFFATYFSLDKEMIINYDDDGNVIERCPKTFIIIYPIMCTLFTPLFLILTKYPHKFNY